MRLPTRYRRAVAVESLLRCAALLAGLFRPLRSTVARAASSWLASSLGGETDPVPPATNGFNVDLGRTIGVALRTTLYRVRVVGLDNVPPVGAVVFVANHSSGWDGPILFGLLPRRVAFLVKAEMFKGFVGSCLVKFGHYRLDRTTPGPSLLKETLAHLKAGGTIGIFPEGTRGDGAVENIFRGAGWFACRSGARIVPIAIRGTAAGPRTKRRRRPVVDILIGAPFQVPCTAGRASVDQATSEIHSALRELVTRLDECRLMP